MAKPVILTVDDEPQVLNAIHRDLRTHYRREYRVMKSGSGEEAFETILELKKRNDQVALLLSDQRMPKISGTEFLDQARAIYPDAKKVLLTAYADTQAAIDSINSIGLDHYLMKPWDPPEQNLYPVLDELLEDWQAVATIPYDGIRVAGTLWSPDSHTAKEFLARNRLPYQWLDIEKDESARILVESVQEDALLPVVFFPDGDVLIQPDLVTLAEKVGLQTRASEPHYDLVIIGAGPAGLGAAVYGASEGLKTLLIDKEATGGQAGTSSRIENYLGFPQGISGALLAQKATDQARRLGAEILTAQEVVGVRVEDQYRFVTLSDGTEISALSLIIASGVTVRELDAPGVRDLAGAGVYYGAAITEAAYYEGEHVYVVGGANSAGQAAMFFSRFAGKVTMLIRGSSLTKSMSQYLIDQIGATANIELLTHTEVVEAHGEGRLEALTLRDNTADKTWKVETPAVFIFIGAVPHTDMVAEVIERNSAGFILTGTDLTEDGNKPQGWRLKRDPYLLETSVPGIFAAGDVRQGVVRRVASAVGQGAIAVSFVHQYLRMV